MTIKDIAKLSGYGVGTVSRVINNHPDVSEKARETIMKVIEEHNFQPNSNARMLKMQAGSAVNIIVKGKHNLLFSDILEEVQNLLSENGEETYISYLEEEDNEVNQALTLCRENNPKAIIFLGGNLEYFKESFGDINVPCVLLTNTASELKFSNLSSLTTDDRLAAMSAIDYLIDNGHKNIGIVGGNLSSAQISFSRISGAISAFANRGMRFDLEKEYEECRFSMEEAYNATKRLLEKDANLTAIFALSDVIAMGAMRAIKDLGKRVPEDVSVVGYDGIAMTNYLIPRLTTVKQDTSAFAKKAVDLILQRIHYPYGAVHEVVPFELVQRESVRSIK